MTFWKSLVGSMSRDTKSTTVKERLKPEDFRRAQRPKEGYIWSERLIMPRPCVIHDMSPLTAEVVLWNDDIKPDLLSGTLRLYLSTDRKEASCVVSTRNGKSLSLRFMGAFGAPSRKYA